MPIANLTSALPEFQFSDYFASKTSRAYPERVIVEYPAYVHSLSSLLEDTSNDVIESYLVIRSALTLAPNLGLNTEAYKATRSLQETLQGIKPGSVGDRSELCIGKVEGTLGFAAGRYFVNQTFSGDSKDKATKVITGMLGCVTVLHCGADTGMSRYCGCFQSFPEETRMDGQGVCRCRCSEGSSSNFFTFSPADICVRLMRSESKSDSPYPRILWTHAPSRTTTHLWI